MSMPKLGLGLSNVAFDQTNKLSLKWLTEYAVKCENEGVEAIWIMDHVYWQTPTVEQIIALAAIAAVTRKINFGTLVLQLPLRHNSIRILAKQLHNIYEVAGDRLSLGLGLGSVKLEYQVMGIDFTNRAKLFDSDLQLLVEIFDKGFHVSRSTNKIQADEKIFNNIPIWLGSRAGDRALDRVVKYADGWMPLFIDVSELAVARKKINLMVKQSFDKRKSIKYGVSLLINNGDDSQIIANANRFSSLFGMPYKYFSKYVVTGNLKQCASQIQMYLDIGLDHISTLWPTTDPLNNFLEIQSMLNLS